MVKLDVKRILLIISILFYILVMTDVYLPGTDREYKSLAGYKTTFIQQKSIYNRLCDVTLTDNTGIRMAVAKVGFLAFADSCLTETTILFHKVVSVTLKEGDKTHFINTGYINIGGSVIIPWLSTLFFLLALLFLFTPLFNSLQASDFGPYVIFIFQLISFVIYITTA